jgi:aspartyl-tRNA(Asn)/glutamyl-tRNA(Gln) amidotransferase subunit A
MSAPKTILQIRKDLIGKKISSVELINSYLTRIESENPKLNALLTVCRAQALEQASKADKLIIAEGEKAFLKQPLLGIPVVHKDIYVTKGIRTSAGSKVLDNYTPAYDGTSVARLKKAGAIILGKANLDAWAHGSSGENSDFGPTRNPINPEYVPGGSSSGSAVAVAADFSPFATGTDTGGSIRLPASFCGVVGLKPTYGRVSRYGIIAMSSSCDSIGHFTHDVADSALILNITAGHDDHDATTPKVAVPDYRKELNQGVKKLKIGLPKEYFSEGVDPRIADMVKSMAGKMEKAGAEIVEVSLPNSHYSLAVYYIVVPAEVSSNLARFDGIRYGNPRTHFGAEAKRRIMLGSYILSAGYYDAYYLQAMKVRTIICQEFTEVFKKVDALIAPVSPTLPFKLGARTDNPLAMYLSDILTVPMNLAGLPALSLPIGQIDDLPVGMQIIGPQFSESLLFRLGYTCERL